ncbi:glutamate ABC transporter substrate-binding protein [Streptomyces sp. NPDC056632]|uniref:glutamate ABC transporter substrate-binding protein n=1 Tax=Streptomyces sp. NPDC056632 TaxID=3345884 RepID=UPI00367FFB13
MSTRTIPVAQPSAGPTGPSSRPTRRAGRRWIPVALALTASLLTGACSAAAPAGSAGAAGGTDAPSAGSQAAIAELISAHAPAAEEALSASPTAAAIRKRGVLRVGGTQTAALFSLLNPATGKVEGFDAAMSQLLAKHIIGRPETELVNVTAQTREALLKNHSVDTVFATYTITPEREKSVAFAGPYYTDGLAIQVRKDQEGIASLADLAGKTVITQSGSTAANEIRKAAPTAQVQLFENNTECLQALRHKRADAYVLDQGILAGNALRNPDVKVLPGTYSQQPYGIGLPLDQPDFKQFVNTWLKQVIADGTWAKVWQATVGTQVPGQVPAPPTVA